MAAALKTQHEEILFQCETNTFPEGRSVPPTLVETKIFEYISACIDGNHSRSLQNLLSTCKPLIDTLFKEYRFLTCMQEAYDENAGECLRILETYAMGPSFVVCPASRNRKDYIRSHLKQREDTGKFIAKGVKIEFEEEYTVE